MFSNGVMPLSKPMQAFFSFLYALFAFVILYLTNITTTNAVLAAIITIAVFVVRYIEQDIQNLINPPSPTPAPSPSPSPSPAPTPTPAPSPFTLACSNLAAKIGDTVTFTITGGAANSTAALYQTGLPYDSSDSITQNKQLDANGSCTFSYVITPVSVIGGVIASEGSISLYAEDSELWQSNTLTIT